MVATAQVCRGSGIAAGWRRAIGNGTSSTSARTVVSVVDRNGAGIGVSVWTCVRGWTPVGVVGGKPIVESSTGKAIVKSSAKSWTESVVESWAVEVVDGGVGVERASWAPCIPTIPSVPSIPAVPTIASVPTKVRIADVDRDTRGNKWVVVEHVCIDRIVVAKTAVRAVKAANPRGVVIVVEIVVVKLVTTVGAIRSKRILICVLAVVITCIIRAGVVVIERLLRIRIVVQVIILGTQGSGQREDAEGTKKLNKIISLHMCWFRT